jgi:hypothetical protein
VVTGRNITAALLGQLLSGTIPEYRAYPPSAEA